MTKIFMVLSFLASIYGQTLAEDTKALIVFPHVSASHASQAYSLVMDLMGRGYQVTLVTPYPRNYPGITEISIEGIVEPLREFTHNFIIENNKPNCYWWNLKYAKEVGYQYAKHIIENENFTKIFLETDYTSIILEDVGANALAVLSEIYDNAPLTVVLSDPLSVFYDNYFRKIRVESPWGQWLEAHHWVLKEMYRELFILPDQEVLARKIYENASGLIDDTQYSSLTEALSATKLVLMPAYSTFGNYMPAYPHAKIIGGFKEQETRNLTLYKPEELNGQVILISKNIPDIVFNYYENLLKSIYPQDLVVHSPNITDVALYNVRMIITDGDVYETSYAFNHSQSLVHFQWNKWQQWFVMDTLVDMGLARKASEPRVFYEPRNYLSIMFTPISVSPINKDLDSDAAFWIDYLNIKFMRDYSVEYPYSVVNRGKGLIVALILIDIALFAFFFWLIKHIIHIAFITIGMLCYVMVLGLSLFGKDIHKKGGSTEKEKNYVEYQKIPL